jgi:hypothetical protein
MPIVGPKVKAHLRVHLRVLPKEEIKKRKLVVNKINQ